MKQDLEFTFRTSISREGYDNKETAKMCLSSITAKEIGHPKMAFKEETVTVDEFLEYAINGYSFCNLFHFDTEKQYWIRTGGRWTKTYPIYRRGLNKGYFKLNFKSDEFFAGSQTIFVDVDYTHYQSITDYISCLSNKPTCAYYSYSDRKDKNGVISRRFRLVYVFDSVLSVDEFRETTFALYDSIVADTKEEMQDMCGCSFSQYMNGSNSDDTYNSHIIYSKDDFHVEPIIPDVEEEYQVIEEKPVKTNKIAFTEELVTDMESLPYEFVVRKWHAKGLRYFTKTAVDFGDKYYITTTEDYYQLFYIANKVEDGNQRRKKLYIRASIRRLMKDDTTPDELLYNLYIDRYKHFDNMDEVLTVEVLKAKVKAAFLTSEEEIKSMVSDKKPNFIINPTVEDKHQAVAAARKEITNETIGCMFDSTLTIKENQLTMQNAGYTVSISRLYQFCKENNITPEKPKTRTKKTIIEGYNPELSIRKNMKVLGCTMYQVQQAKKNYHNNKNDNLNNN